jgi:hypothetical protein
MEAIFANRREDMYYYTEEWSHLLQETFTRALLTQRYTTPPRLLCVRAAGT